MSDTVKEKIDLTQLTFEPQGKEGAIVGQVSKQIACLSPEEMASTSKAAATAGKMLPQMVSYQSSKAVTTILKKKISSTPFGGKPTAKSKGISGGKKGNSVDEQLEGNLKALTVTPSVSDRQIVKKAVSKGKDEGALTVVSEGSGVTAAKRREPVTKQALDNILALLQEAINEEQAKGTGADVERIMIMARTIHACISERLRSEENELVRDLLKQLGAAVDKMVKAYKNTTMLVINVIGGIISIIGGLMAVGKPFGKLLGVAANGAVGKISTDMAKLISFAKWSGKFAPVAQGLGGGVDHIGKIEGSREQAEQAEIGHQQKVIETTREERKGAAESDKRRCEQAQQAEAQRDRQKSEAFAAIAR
jgi:hypothetical protein